MGCLPGLILFLVATGAGWWLGGANGVVWGAVTGVVAGALTSVAMIMLLRRASRGTRRKDGTPHAGKQGK